jgi:hypothetical protein
MTSAKPATASAPTTAVTRLPRPGRGLAVAALLLAAVEVWLHSDAFLLRYRSVFAAGRAWDKLSYVQRQCPQILVLGNSRADNGFDPRTVVRALGGASPVTAFNLGLPGADAGVLRGAVDRLKDAGCLGASGVRVAVIALDESLVQQVDTLGQKVFFGNVRQMWRDEQYHDALRASFRLYGFSDNLSQLREPATLQRFVKATLDDVEPGNGRMPRPRYGRRQAAWRRHIRSTSPTSGESSTN